MCFDRSLGIPVCLFGVVCVRRVLFHRAAHCSLDVICFRHLWHHWNGVFFARDERMFGQLVGRHVCLFACWRICLSATFFLLLFSVCPCQRKYFGKKIYDGDINT